MFARPTNRFSPYRGEVDRDGLRLMPMPQTSAMSPVKPRNRLIDPSRAPPALASMQREGAMAVGHPARKHLALHRDRSVRR